MAKAKKNAGTRKGYGIERKGLGYDGMNEGRLPFAFPTKELADEWLQLSAKLGADFGTYACSGGLCQDDYSVVESNFGYAKVDSPDAEKDYYLQEFKLIDVSGLPVLTCGPAEMTVEQAKELLNFLFIDDDGAESDRMGIYASRLLRCLNAADKGAYNNGYEVFDPTCCYWDEKEIVLPEGITEIGEMEYQCARNLESIVIPEGVVKIGCAAFYHCRKLKAVKFPSTLKEIEEKAFCGCDALEGIRLPDGLEKIGTDAFDEEWYGEKKIVECSDFSTLSEYSWRELLVKHPELGDRCTCWDEFDSSDWEEILKDAPQFAAKCKKWSKFNSYEIVRILKAQPQLAAKWKSLSKLEAGDWSSLLRERPEFAGCCSKWNKFDASDWSRLLAEQPRFADKCKAWSQFEDGDWDRVVKKGAKFKKLRKEFGPKQLSGYPADYVRGEAKGLYCIIDVSGGKDAAKYSVSYLDAMPDGGWSDEYKTSKIALRLVAPTTFSMGAEGVDDNPVHQVKLTRPYYIGVFEVTQKQWELVTGRNPSRHDDESDSAMRPVEQVSYRRIRGEKQGMKWPNSACVDKDSFLGILRKKSGIKNIDLPTEAEWTCACKPGFAGLDRNAVEGIAWTDGNSNEETHPVGELAPNGLGLYDILGNVWEWCVDRYGTFSKSKVTDPIGYSVSSKFVSHGACCYNGSRSMNSSNRNSDSASETGSGLGLRLGITLEKASKELLQKASEIAEVKILGNWAKLSAENWRDLLEEQPQFADKCDKWSAFDAHDWSWILSKQPQFSNKCEKWALFDGSDWSRLLAHQPQFVNECDACAAWCEFGACDWATLIAAQPQFADKCDKWNIFDDDDWIAVLSAQPQLIDMYKCSKYKHNHDGDIILFGVLRKQPQFNYGELPGPYYASRWRDLMIAQPRFVSQYKAWTEAERKKWVDRLFDLDMALLAANKICEELFLKLKNPCSWAVAIALSGNPTLAKKIKVSRVMDDVAEEVSDRLWNDDGFNVTPWASPAAFLLRNQPAFIKDIDVSKFTCEDWLCVLQKQPQFADKCDWENFEKEWDDDTHAMYLDTDELRSLVQNNANIDVSAGADIFDCIHSPMLMKRFDSGDWKDPTWVWSLVLGKYPEKAIDFERDHFTVKPKEESAEQDEGKLHIYFRNWNDWGESTWKSYEQKLMLNDESINKQFDEKWRAALEDCDNFDEVEFLTYACKRNVCWSKIFHDEGETWYELACEEPSFLNNDLILDKVAKWFNDKTYASAMGDDCAPDCVFDGWENWTDDRWTKFEGLLIRNDSRISGIFQQGLADLLMVEYDYYMSFLRVACKRTSRWLEVLDEKEVIEFLRDTPALLKDNESSLQILERIVRWCDGCAESDGYYEDDDWCDYDEDGTINRWAYTLGFLPILSSRCTTYQKFNAYSQCALIAQQPQFADKFSLEELGDPNAKCWSVCDSDRYVRAWELMIEARPDFAKYRKG